MRYRLALLCLAAVLGVLPGLTTVSAVPAPRRPKPPTIYALIYVGLGKSDPDNAERIANALQSLRSGGSGGVREPEAKDLSIVQDKERELGWMGRDKWANSKTRAANLEGTAVVGVWFTDGSPEEQVILTNAIARDYVKDRPERVRGALEALESEKRFYIKNVVKRPLNKEEERTFRRRGEAIKHFPHVIEWAALPEKP